MNRRAQDRDLIRLRPRENTLYVAQSQTVLATNREGFIDAESEQGLFVFQTRLLSRYRFLINNTKPIPVALSNVQQHSWLGYYILYPPDRNGNLTKEAKENAPLSTKETLELRLSRYVGDGLHEDVDVTNYSDARSSFQLTLQIEADFADIIETSSIRKQQGKQTFEWRQNGSDFELIFHYFASHDFENQNEKGHATFGAGVIIKFKNCDSPPRYTQGSVLFDITLEPLSSWHTCIDVIPILNDKQMVPHYSCRSFHDVSNEFEMKRDLFLTNAPTFDIHKTSGSMGDAIRGAIERAKHDLIALRLFDLDAADDSWVPAAGLPVYVAIYGRDILTAALQSSMVGTELMKGALNVLARLQGTEINDWRDEQPGRMIHEARTGPLSKLNYLPHGRYYGSATTSGFYPVVLSELWHWTGEKELLQPFINPALKALQWLERYSDQDHDGFYEYHSNSAAGVKNQGWKDSDDAIVYEDGQLVRSPIATCEEQAFVYIAKLHLSEVFWWLDEKDLAKKLYREAEELKHRFNDSFWMEDEKFLAMGLDSKKRQIRSIGSNAGHCIASGIVDASIVEPVARRLLEPDLFTGWGIRTLSSRHPRFNPYSYHRGSVWPVEHGSFAIGFMRYGFHELNEQMTRGMFEAAQLFDFYRLPELFAGHQRDADHPFPALYPDACSPQAWSASCVFSMVQSLLGLYPYAPLHILLIDPHLPEWLPELTIHRLKIGGANCTIRFFRKDDGESDFKVLEVEGKLHIIRQPSPWSLTAGFAERLKDLLSSYI